MPKIKTIKHSDSFVQLFVSIDSETIKAESNIFFCFYFL